MVWALPILTGWACNDVLLLRAPCDGLSVDGHPPFRAARGSRGAAGSGVLLLSYGVGTSLQLFWFSKIAKGLVAVLLLQKVVAMKALGYGGKKQAKKSE